VLLPLQPICAHAAPCAPDHAPATTQSSGSPARNDTVVPSHHAADSCPIMPLPHHRCETLGWHAHHAARPETVPVPHGPPGSDRHAVAPPHPLAHPPPPPGALPPPGRPRRSRRPGSGSSPAGRPPHTATGSPPLSRGGTSPVLRDPAA